MFAIRQELALLPIGLRYLQQQQSHPALPYRSSLLQVAIRQRLEPLLYGQQPLVAAVAEQVEYQTSPAVMALVLPAVAAVELPLWVSLISHY